MAKEACPRRFVSDLELAYMAGIIDGEGCLSLARRGKKRAGYMTPILQVSNTDRPLVDWLSEAFGGNVYRNEDKRGTRKTLWLWSCSGRVARETVRLVRPYLRVKVRQADLLLQFYPVGQGGRNGSRPLTEREIAAREAAIEEMRGLNRRGRQLRLEPARVGGT